MEKPTLIVCDMQPDSLQSILPVAERDRVVDLIYLCVHTAWHAEWKIVFTGVQFEEGYEDVNTSHKIFGGLKRLADAKKQMGGEAPTWFVSGEPGSKIDERVLPNPGDHNVKELTPHRSILVK